MSTQGSKLGLVKYKIPKHFQNKHFYILQLAAGCKQGDPLNPCIFILSIEYLAMEILLD